MMMLLIAVARDRKTVVDTETIFNDPVFRLMSSHGIEPGQQNISQARCALDERIVQACAEACGIRHDLIERAMMQTVFEIRGSFNLDLLRQTWQLLQDEN